MNGYYEQLIKILRAYDYKKIRSGKGSHEIWSNGKINITVPFNCNSRHTANAILKRAKVNTKI